MEGRKEQEERVFFCPIIPIIISSSNIKPTRETTQKFYALTLANEMGLSSYRLSPSPSSSTTTMEIILIFPSHLNSVV